MPEDKKIWEEDFSEELTIMAIAVVLIISMVVLKADASNLVSAGLGGLIGYLKRSSKTI